MRITYLQIQRFCIHDGPGVRTTVFLKGCPLRCAWCHNPESWIREPQLLYAEEKCASCGRCVGLCGARERSREGKLVFDREKCVSCGKCVTACLRGANSLKGISGTADEILEVVVRDQPFYDRSGGGLTISGGEPSAQAEGTLELIEKAKKRGINSAVETCGYGPEEFFRRAARLDTLFLFDIKGIEEEKHRRNTGVGTETIHARLRNLLEAEARVILRMPLIPGYNDSREDLLLLREFLRQCRDGIEYAEIMPYHGLGNQKRRRLGMQADHEIPEGKIFADQWKIMLEASGASVRISGG